MIVVMKSIKPKDLNAQAKLPSFTYSLVSKAKITEYSLLIVDFKKYSRSVLKAL